MTGLRTFAEKVPCVASAAELQRLLCEHIGVDTSCVQGWDAWACELGGLRVDPGHLAQFLWSLRDLCPRSRTFLHVGTRHGTSFVAISEFLRHHVDPTIAAHTVDEHNYVLTDALPYLLSKRRMVHPTRALAGRRYDIVFIESGSADDYRHVGQHATVCAWHCPGIRDAAHVSPRHSVHTTYGDIAVLVHT